MAVARLQQRVVEGGHFLDLNFENCHLTDAEVIRFARSRKTFMAQCKGKYEVRLNCS